MAKSKTRSTYSAKTKKQSDKAGWLFAILVLVELVFAAYAVVQFIPRYFPQHIDLVPQMGILAEYVFLFGMAITTLWLLMKRPYWALSALLLTLVFSLPVQRILVHEPDTNAEVFCPKPEEKICPSCPVCPEPVVVPPTRVLYYGLDPYSFDEASFIKSLQTKIRPDDVVILGRVNEDWLPHVKMLMDNFVTHGFFMQNDERYAVMSHRSDVLLHPVALDENLLKPTSKAKPATTDEVETLDELLERHGVRQDEPDSVNFHSVR